MQVGAQDESQKRTRRTHSHVLLSSWQLNTAKYDVEAQRDGLAPMQIVRVGAGHGAYPDYALSAQDFTNADHYYGCRNQEMALQSQ